MAEWRRAFQSRGSIAASYSEVLGSGPETACPYWVRRGHARFGPPGHLTQRTADKGRDVPLLGFPRDRVLRGEAAGGCGKLLNGELHDEVMEDEMGDECSTHE